MKAVIDTNVFVSGVFWKGTPHKILTAWYKQKFQMLLSREILEEYQRVLHILNKDRKLVDVDSLLKIVGTNSVIIEPMKFGSQVCTDKDDDKFLEAAVSAKADYLVSGDKALLKVEELSGVLVIKPNKFLELIG